MTGAAPALRAAVVGAGRIGAGFSQPGRGAILTHAAAYRACALTELVAVCDDDAAVASTRAREWGVPGFVDVRDMLAVAVPDVVSICTPDETHVSLAAHVFAAPSVRGVLMEKPLALSVRDAERTMARAAERGAVLAVNYSRRWGAGIRRTANLLQSGRLGAVHAVVGHYASGLLHNGTHWIDLARMLVGEVVRVRALSSRDSGAMDSPLDVELEFACGARGILLGHAGTALSFFEMDVICERGRVRLSRGANAIEVFELAPSPTYAGFVTHVLVETIEAGLDDAMLLAVEDVARCVIRGGEPACTGRDGVQALRIAQAARSGAGDWALPERVK